MEEKIENREIEKPKEKYLLPVSITVSALIIGGALTYSTNLDGKKNNTGNVYASLQEKVLPPDGVALPARWGDLGIKLVSSGVIDKEKLESIYTARGGLSTSEKKLLERTDNGNLKITPENANFLLNLLWAPGLGNKNEILEKGPMADPRYGGTANFASTGGWTIASGSAMAHYSRHQFVILTPEQQRMVESVSKNIYRPCCDNSVYFPDCNHGMAMLGLLELMASQGVSENEMYKIALQVNSYWFPDTYFAIARLLEKRGIEWDNADPKQIVGYQFSSFSGFQKILEQIEPVNGSNGAGCGV
ncbi:MAG: hypothetical protein HY432_01475 [Candidatus Liptonbacteria bacterium]|nr:hypothetical protein [Candidatus Liptonbacteria bacterium]